MRTLHYSILICSFFSLFNFSYSQNSKKLIQKYLEQEKSNLQLSNDDIANWLIYNEHSSEKFNLNYVYIIQTHEKIEVYNAVANFAIRGENILLTGNNLQKDITKRVNATKPTLRPEDAVLLAIDRLEIEVANRKIDRIEKIKNEFVIDAPGISIEKIPVKLMYVNTPNGDLKLAWDFSINTLSKKNWWSVKIDALNGELLDKVDWVVNCVFENCNHDETYQHGPKPVHHVSSESEEKLLFPAPPPGTDQYRVFAIPTESPSHGPRTLVVGPSDATASPFGWHDDNGVLGNESTITNGNNVYATEDVNDNNGTGYSPNGGASINFDFPLNLNQQPSNYQDPVITNLFYMNNIMHDVWYHYGFDEAAGNFQENNYGNGGSQSDKVNADAQDGGGINNANFSTPTDGNNPRMQMYLWTPNIQDLLTVNSPAGIAGAYGAIEAGFGSPVPASPITTNLVIFDDNIPDDYDACSAAVNAAAINGKICIIRRGDCLFVDKIQFAQNAGAVAVIMVNNVAGAPIVMGGTAPGITIPSVMVSDLDGELLIAQIEGGATVNATLQNSGSFDVDGDFDNGIIAHEYGHGISTRLTGGAGNSNCLNNEEQMGEGWSDWFGIMLTMEPGDLATDNRGVGTYVTGESTNGVGIRPAPYNTDMAINGYTYAATNDAANISQPHGIGFVWATMLWDLSWALIDKYGFDADVYTGTGGNNVAMHLVINGLKLQSCSPGFEDGRDAILQADQLLYGGANQCLIWNVFANRGLGFSANQGSTDNRSDQTEAFDLPPSMINSAGSANVSACNNYTWTANGQSYSSSGSYVAMLTNSMGCDSTATLNLTINNPTSGSISIAACDSYTWPTDGNTYTSSGAYSATLTNAAGCDSIVTLNLQINTGVGSTQNISACAAYIWPADGNTYSSTGTYTALLTSTAGCDSLATLNFTMSTSASSSQSVTACESYFWAADGATYSSSGSYVTTLLSGTGCDSIVTLNLTINSGSSGSGSITACQSYTWPANGITYTSSGSYNATIPNMYGCDSVATLNLTINTSVVGSTETISACSSYLWPTDGNTYSSSGIYNATLTNSAGCDSIVSLDLSINNSTTGSGNVTSCFSYTWPSNGQTYTSSGAYVAALTGANGCDSTATLNLTINSVNVSISYVDVVTLTAGASGATYQWLDCNNNYSPIAGATNQVYNAPINGTYAVQVTENGCTDTTACRTISQVGVEENEFGDVLLVHPNPTFGKVTVELGEIYDVIITSLVDMAGRVVASFETKNSNTITIDIDEAPGYYFLDIKTEHKKARVRVLKE